MATPVAYNRTLESSLTHCFLSHSTSNLSGNLNVAPFNINPESGHFSPFFCYHPALSHYRVSPPTLLTLRLLHCPSKWSPHIYRCPCMVYAKHSNQSGLLNPKLLLSSSGSHLTKKPKVSHGLQGLKCSGFCPLSHLIPYYSLLPLSASATLASLFMDHTSLELLYWLFSLPGPLFPQLSTWLFCSLFQVFAQMTPIMTFWLEVASTCHLTILTLPVSLTLPCFFNLGIPITLNISFNSLSYSFWLLSIFPQ